MQLAEDVEPAIEVLDRGGLGDLDDDPARIDPARVEPVEDPRRDVGLPELARREVEADLQGDLRLAPRRVLARDLLDHPVADRLDQAELLGQRDEVVGRHEGSVGLAPAQQRLDPDHPRRGEVDDRLVVQLPALLLDRLAQAGDERQLRDRVDARGRGEHVAADPTLLRLGHRRLGAEEQVLAGARVLGEQRQADARGQVQLGARDRERLAQRVLDPPGHALRGHDGGVVLTHLVALEVGEQEEELVAAHPRHEVGLARRLTQPFGELPEHLVAGLVTERVVHELEVVDIHHEHRDRALVSSGTCHREVEELVEHRPVRQPRALVVIGEERRLLLRLLLQGDVLHEPLRVRGARSVVDDLRDVAHPHDAAVLVDQPVLQVEGLAGCVVPVVLRQRVLAVVGMQHAHPEVVLGHELLGGVAEQLLDLRAHVGGRCLVVELVGVGDRGDVLDQRAVARLRLAPRLVGDLTTDRGPQVRRHHAQHVELVVVPDALGDAVVESHEAPPVVPGEDRYEAVGVDVLVDHVVELVPAHRRALLLDDLPGRQPDEPVRVPVLVGPVVVVGQIDRRLDPLSAPLEPLVHHDATELVGAVLEHVGAARFRRRPELGEDLVDRVLPASRPQEPLGRERHRLEDRLAAPQHVLLAHHSPGHHEQVAEEQPRHREQAEPQEQGGRAGRGNDEEGGRNRGREQRNGKDLGPLPPTRVGTPGTPRTRSHTSQGVSGGRTVDCRHGRAPPQGPPRAPRRHDDRTGRSRRRGVIGGTRDRSVPVRERPARTRW